MPNAHLVLIWQCIARLQTQHSNEYVRIMDFTINTSHATIPSPKLRIAPIDPNVVRFVQ